MVQLSFSSSDVFLGKHDAVTLFTYEERSDAEARLAQRAGRDLALVRARKEFEGKRDQLLVVPIDGTPRFLLLVGLGKRAEITAHRMRTAAHAATNRARELGAKTVALEVPVELDANAAAQAVTEGAAAGSYTYVQYKTQDAEKRKELDAITIASDRTGMAARQGFDAGVIIGETCAIVRDLQNTPSADLTPELFGEEAAKIAKSERLSITVLDKRQLEKQGYGGIVGVGKGSAADPRLITILYEPKGATRTVVIVGKGITFDTGGYSIKPSAGMGLMKFDMSGAAVALGIIRAASRLKLPVRVIAVMALAENMVSGAAYKPGDVVRTKSGKTIEIENTDAEGRVVLADALYHATLLKPDLIIDLATLTGACVVALGDNAAAVLGTDQAAIDRLRDAGERTGERLWPLPLWEEYEKDIESQIADYRNMGTSKMAGTIAGAMLLKQFVGDVPWVHIDIAGVAWAEARDRFLTRKGEGTAFGVRLVLDYLRS